MTDKLRGLAERWKVKDASQSWEAWNARSKCAAELLTILDVEGDGGVATLHADGYWTWKGTPPHESNYAGWKMDVYATQPRSVPDGWMLVPREPTPKMVDACIAGWQERVRRKAENGTLLSGGNAGQSFRENYAVMIAAAPQPGEPS